jgi:Methyltransferase domain
MPKAFNKNQNLVKKIWKTLPESPKRFLKSFFYDKNTFLLKNSFEVFKDVYEKNLWESSESKSGGGSMIEGTITIRKQLPEIISKYDIKTMLDVPCGDYNWMKEVEKNCNYIGGDIVSEIVERNQKLYSSEKVTFKKIDITRDNLEKVDLIFCKDCLQHLSDENVKKAINNFKKSGSKFLLVTSYPKTWRNHDVFNGDYRPLNLLVKPFYLVKPIIKIKEKSILKDIEPDKTMYLFFIESLPNF